MSAMDGASGFKPPAKARAYEGPQPGQVKGYSSEDKAVSKPGPKPNQSLARAKPEVEKGVAKPNNQQPLEPKGKEGADDEFWNRMEKEFFEDFRRMPSIR